MPNYCVNANAQANGDHEVHDLTPGRCGHLPDYSNRKSLGFHSNCRSAVAQAKQTFRQSNGCAYCCPECHTQ